jgi:hypothetical protein
MLLPLVQWLIGIQNNQSVTDSQLDPSITSQNTTLWGWLALQRLISRQGLHRE